MTSRFLPAAARFALPSASCALALALASSTAHAQQPAPASNCPPGSWFCADTQEKPAAPPGQPVAPQRLEPLPGSQPAPAPAPPAQPPPQVIYQQSPPVVYQMPPPVVLYQPTPQQQPPPPPPAYHPSYEAPPPYYYRPRPADPVSRPREWGLNLRIEGGILGHDAAKNSGMGGLGFGLRYKPVPAFGLEADVDFWGGRDYYGDQRQETAFALNALFFVNPRSKVQVYFLAGLGWSSASVNNNDTSLYSTQANYTYFGGQAGGGLEFRLGRHFALNADVRGFIRGRTDSGAQTSPEYVDPTTGRTTNTSGGGIVTGGMTFYF